jgi:hypothetical protein
MTPTQFDAIVTRLDAILAALATPTADNQPTPALESSSDLPEAPEGFHPAMMGPVKGANFMVPSSDIIGFEECGEWDMSQWYGTAADQIYALRKGSQIAKLNNLE